MQMTFGMPSLAAKSMNSRRCFSIFSWFSLRLSPFSIEAPPRMAHVSPAAFTVGNSFGTSSSTDW